MRHILSMLQLRQDHWFPRERTQSRSTRLNADRLTFLRYIIYHILIKYNNPKSILEFAPAIIILYLLIHESCKMYMMYNLCIRLLKKIMRFWKLRLLCGCSVYLTTNRLQCSKNSKNNLHMYLHVNPAILRSSPNHQFLGLCLINTLLAIRLKHYSIVLLRRYLH